MAVQGSSASMAAGLELSWAFARPSPRTIMRKRGSSPGILRGPAPPPPPAGRPGAPAAGTRALFTPDPLFLVWMEGLPAQEGWSFHYEYVEPCVARYGGAFLADRSFLVDRHDVQAAQVPALTWGVLAFNEPEAAKECGMAVAAGPLVAAPHLPGPPKRVTVRRRIMAPQDTLDQLAAEMQRQRDEQAGKLVAHQLAQAEARRAAGTAGGTMPAFAEEEAPPPPPPPPPVAAEAEAPPPPPLPQQRQQAAQTGLHARMVPSPTPPPPPPEPAEKAAPPAPPVPPEPSPSPPPPPPPAEDLSAGLFFSGPKPASQTAPQAQQPRQARAPQAEGQGPAAQPRQGGGAPPDNRPDAGLFFTQRPQKQRGQAAGTGAAPAQQRLVNAAPAGAASKQQVEAHTKLPRSPYENELPVQPGIHQKQVGKQTSKHNSAAAGATAPAAKGGKQERQRGKGPGTAGRAGDASMPAAAGAAAASRAKHGKQQKQLAALATAPGKQTAADAEPGSPRSLGSPRPLGSPRGSSQGHAAAAMAAQAAAAAAPAAVADEGVREKVRAFLQQGLQLAAKELQQLGEQPAGGGWDAAATAAAVEAALLEQHSGATSKQYREKARSLGMNLKAQDNRELRQQVLRREIAPQELVCMSSEQLAPRSLQQRREQLRQESLRQAVLPPDLAAQVSTAAALELKRSLLGAKGTPSATPLGGSQPASLEDDAALPAAEAGSPGLAAAAEPAQAGTPSAEVHAGADAEADAGGKAQDQPLGARGPAPALAASPRLGNGAPAVVSVGGISPLKPLSERAPPSHAGPRSPGHSMGSDAGGYVSDHEAAAAIWDYAELGLGPNYENRPTGAAGLAAAAAAQRAQQAAPPQQPPLPAAAQPRALPSAPEAAALLLHESSDEERTGTPDLGSPGAAALPHMAVPLQQAQRDGTPDLEADEAALQVPALTAAGQQAQQAQRDDTPDLEADEAALLIPAPAAQQAQQVQRDGTPDLDADEAALLIPALAAAGQQAQQAQRNGTPDLDADEAALLVPALAAQQAQRDGTPDQNADEAALLAPLGAQMPESPGRAGTPDLGAGQAAAQQAQHQHQQDVPTEQERLQLRQQRWQQKKEQQAAEQAQQLAAQQQDGGVRAAEQEQQRRDGRAQEGGEYRAGSKRRERSRRRSRQQDREDRDRGPGHASRKGSGRSERSTKPKRSRSRSRSRNEGRGCGERRSPHAGNKGSTRAERSPKPSRRSSSQDGHGRRKDRREEVEEGGPGSRGRAKRRRSKERKGDEERHGGSGSGRSDARKKPRRERDLDGSRSRSPAGRRRQDSGGSDRRASCRGSGSKHDGGERKADKRTERKRSRSRSRERRSSRGPGDAWTGGNSAGTYGEQEHPAPPPPPAWQPSEQPPVAAGGASPPPPLPAALPAVESLPPGFGAEQPSHVAPLPAAPPEQELQEQLSLDLPALGWGWGTQHAQQPLQARHLDPRLHLRQAAQHPAPQQPAGAAAAPGPPQTLFQQPSGGLEAWQAGPPQEQAQQAGWQQAAQPLQRPPSGQLWHQPSGGVEILREGPPTDAEPFWRGHLEWPQAGGTYLLRLPVTAQGWSAPHDGPPLRLPERLTVTATMPGAQLMPFLTMLPIPSCKVCWFLLSPGAAADQLLSSQDLRDDKVGVCQLRLEGTQLFEEQQWWQGGSEHRGWAVHVLKPNDEVNFFAGVHPEDVAAAGLGALLALALPAWHGWLYTDKDRYRARQPNCAVRMLGPPLLHELPSQLVVPHRIKTDLHQFVQHRDQLVQQGLLLKARRTADGADVEALRGIAGGLRQAGRAFALPLGRAEMLLLPHHDGKHLQAALWSRRGADPQADRAVFDPWSLRLEGLLAPRS